MVSSMRVLLVEDEARVARFVARGLREHAYAVDVVGDGETALFQASVNDYDVIILDVMIPKMDGLRVCRELRAAGLATPVLMLTARDGVDDRIVGLDTGADDYLTKPFAFGELLARLRALLRRGVEVRPEVVAIDDLTVDLQAHRVTRGGRVVHLTTKEYALLEFFVRNANRVVTRAEISEHVWDESYDPFTNVIEVYVGRLRRKIDGDSPTSLIHTRRGAGYILSSAAPPEGEESGGEDAG
jgi:two-component system copper resistance phosphate regulon response regulator CusR